MGKILLSATQIRDLIAANKYRVHPKTQFISRCIDGRYPNSEDLPALAFPGADAGQLAALFATANSCGFEVDNEKVFQSLCEVVGGVQNLRFHTDEHAGETLMGGCGHVKNQTNDPEAFNLHADQITFIKEKAKEAIEKGAVQVVLTGEHMEGGILIISGDYGVYPQQKTPTGKGEMSVQVFEFHKTLVDKRHRAFVKALIQNKAVTLVPGQDEEYLYEVLSSATEDHLMEIAKRLAKGLTIYSVMFEESGEFTVEESGSV